jgi:hypothetical protein
MIENKNKSVSVWCPLSEEALEMIEMLSSAGNSADRIADVLKVDKRLFMHDFRTSGTPIFDAYQKGLILNQTAVNTVTLENAKKGNLTAIQQINKIWEAQNLENIKNEIFNAE